MMYAMVCNQFGKKTIGSGPAGNLILSCLRQQSRSYHSRRNPYEITEHPDPCICHPVPLS